MQNSRLPNYEYELGLLKIKLNEMFSLAIETFKSSIKALENSDLKLAKKIIKEDDNLDHINRNIEKTAYEILSRFHPLASDLRRTVMATKISNELERIGDQAVNIAQVAEIMEGKKMITPLKKILKMSQIVEEMSRECIKAYMEENIDLSKKVWLRDNEVDELDLKVLESIKDILLKREYGESIEHLERLILVSRAIERIADHITNICEEIVYIVVGKEMYDVL